MRYSLVLLLCLVACNVGTIANPTSGPAVQFDYDPPRGEPKSPANSMFAVVSDSGSDAGIDCSLPDASDSDSDANSSFDAGIDSSSAEDASAPTCESGTTVVGHCLYNMATACQEYFSDHSVECKDLVVHPMGGSWWPGPCGGEPGTDLTYSNGGCQDECQSIHWNYPLNKGAHPPTDISRQGWKDTCEAFPGGTYIPVP